MRITLPSGTPAELARPEEDARRGVVVHPDIMGLRPLFDDLCARLAREHGWVVCAIEPYPGQEDLPLDKRLNGPLDNGHVLADLAEAADATGCDRVAVIGFCMGGMQVHRAAGTGRFDRGVSFYGMISPPEQWREPGNDPLDALSREEACPVLAIIGERDHFTPPDDVAALERLPNVTVARYPEADHGFVHDPDRPAHRAEDARDAWQRTAEFLA